MRLDDRIGVLLSKELKETLKKIANRKHLKMSDVIREALRVYVEQQNNKE